jgi:hypothetical protein
MIGNSGAPLEHLASVMVCKIWVWGGAKAASHLGTYFFRKCGRGGRGPRASPGVPHPPPGPPRRLADRAGRGDSAPPLSHAPSSNVLFFRCPFFSILPRTGPGGPLNRSIRPHTAMGVGSRCNQSALQLPDTGDSVRVRDQLGAGGWGLGLEGRGHLPSESTKHISQDLRPNLAHLCQRPEVGTVSCIMNPWSSPLHNTPP